MVNSRYQPSDVFEELTKEVGNLFRGTVADALHNVSAGVDGSWTPAIDIREEDERYVVEVDLPGVSPKEVDLTFENGVLTIQGSRSRSEIKESDTWYRSERKTGNFMRRLSLPDQVDDEKISANGKDGVLTILLPKKEKAQPKKISVD